jgi:hypothetical protein
MSTEELYPTKKRKYTKKVKDPTTGSTYYYEYELKRSYVKRGSKNTTSKIRER